MRPSPPAPSGPTWCVAGKAVGRREPVSRLLSRVSTGEWLLPVILLLWGGYKTAYCTVACMEVWWYPAPWK